MVVVVVIIIIIIIIIISSSSTGQTNLGGVTVSDPFSIRKARCQVPIFPRFEESVFLPHHV